LVAQSDLSATAQKVSIQNIAVMVLAFLSLLSQRS
jgi:hypothetical protein